MSPCHLISIDIGVDGIKDTLLGAEDTKTTV